MFVTTVMGPALPPLYKRSASSSLSEGSDQEDVFSKRAKYSESGDDASSKYDCLNKMLPLYPNFFFQFDSFFRLHGD